MEGLRKEINSIDMNIIRLIAKRLRICRKIGLIKAKKGIPVLDRQQEKEMLNKRMQEAEKHSIRAGLVKNLFSHIISDSRRMQSGIRKEKGKQK